MKGTRVRLEFSSTYPPILSIVKDMHKDILIFILFLKVLYVLR
jgi:hypothetical protein